MAKEIIGVSQEEGASTTLDGLLSTISSILTQKTSSRSKPAVRKALRGESSDEVEVIIEDQETET
jgi:hypothetical protein